MGYGDINFVGRHYFFIQMHLSNEDADPLNNSAFPISSHNYSGIES